MKITKAVKHEPNDPLLYRIRRWVLLRYFPLARKIGIRKPDSTDQNIQDYADAYYAS